MSTKFVIDANQVVHTSYCGGIGTNALPYVTAPKDYVEMAAWLARPDASNGLISQAGSTMLKPCPLCVPSD